MIRIHYGRKQPASKENKAPAAGEIRVVHVCRECGYVSAVLLQVCPNCGEWRYMVEETDPSAIRRLTANGGEKHGEGERETR